MARPLKYNWEAIELAYEGGLDIESICKKFKITNKLLNNKIHLKKWVVKGYIKSDIEGIKDSVEKLSLNGTKHPEISEMIDTNLSTILEDNEIIGNNRKLLKMAQGIIIKNKNKFDYKTIKNLTGAVRDIEAVANPTVSSTNITNTNTQVSVDVNQELTDEQIRKEILKRGLPLQLMTSIS